MKTRWDKWIKETGTDQDIVYINKPVQLVKTTSFLEKFAETVKKTIKTAKDIEDGIKGRKWVSYYDDRYNQETALKRLESKLGLNCTDICQLVYQALKDLKYEVRYRHIMCRDGGHIQLEYKKNNVWEKIDTSNALQGGSWFNLWCANTSYFIRYDSCFLLKDNGMGGVCV